jgi:hypothetical protein
VSANVNIFARVARERTATSWSDAYDVILICDVVLICKTAQRLFGIVHVFCLT